MRITVRDRVSFPINSQREITAEGYLKVPGRVARVGVQQYLASELGLTDRPPGQIVNVYRPQEEVFSPASLASYDNADITIDHPDDLVNAQTFRQVTVGHVISPGRQDVEDADYVVVDLLIKDQYAIDEINQEKEELSAGYTSEYQHAPGIAPCGTAYEFIQRTITINHIALCDQARAGHLARLFDRKPEGVNPMFKVLLDAGARVEVADEATQQLIQSSIDALKTRVIDAEEGKEKAKVAKDEAEKKREEAEAKADAKDEEIAQLKEKASDAAIAKRLSDVITARDSAIKIAGVDFICDSVEPLKIKRSALDMAGIKCRKYASWDKAPDAYVLAYFDAEEERRENEDDDDPDDKDDVNDSIINLGHDMTKIKMGDAQSVRNSVRQTWLDKRYGKQPEDK
ncbi:MULTISPECIES: DUF2213 domain-containing protein [Yersinia pseudotuberculosis complex]|uniref:Uncharacterized protein conserved in bacteria n=2 Tax=Yersinia pseudotuberculosis complex TaxID=1649845 RepID=A0A0T9PTF2_9GAMM|nr:MULTISPECIES: DUF2213 domain-containing protein [Yersinia pseudotuberculosis complex]ABS46385.1 conserved hypothetical protein [Yersinia pseudotuberculosis IP 31758]AJK18217.1 hypothetical protein BZ19_1205 [Yersinia pseudotuberculosis str. PA3606]MCE4113775.1 DUF2213 domain-containing protein [Yersinia pseudotuberculosis]MCF1165035.1 DUF2213 domain-containing protein [Yersinia pseudotuberculosis]RYC28115.1 DUF2213 domain-containing protein [Yersinia pseudotuberculosis]